MTSATLTDPIQPPPLATSPAATSPLATSPVPAPPRKRIAWLRQILGWSTLAVLLYFYIAFLRAHFAPAISEPDDNGYFAQGTLLAQTGHTFFMAASDAQYIGMHWLVTPWQGYVSRYPPGLPVLLAIVDKIAGWQATVWVNPALSVLTLIGFFLLARKVINTWWALIGVAVLGANPTFLHHAFAGDSHMGVTVCLTWGLYLLIRWSDEGKIRLAFLAGLVLGCIPTVRYADGIMAIGLGVYLLWHWRRFPRIWRHYLAAAGGAAIPILPLLWRNQMLMGAFWRTGYSLTNEETGFSMDYFKEHAIDYVRQVNGNGIGLLFALGFAGMFVMIFKKGEKRNRPLGIALVLMSAAMLLLYMAYYWAPETNPAATLRFLLPTYIAYLLGGLWLIREACGSTAVGQTFIGLALVSMQMVWGTADVLTSTSDIEFQNRSLVCLTDAMEKTIQPGDVVVGRGRPLQDLDFVREWKIADDSLVMGNGGGGGPGGPRGPGGGGPGGRGPGAFGGPGGRGGGMGRFGNNGDPNAPSPMQPAKVEELRQKYAGLPAQKQRKFVADLFAWAGPAHKVYIVGTENEIDQWSGVADGSISIVARIPMPTAPQEDSVVGMTGRGGFGGPGAPGGPGGPGGFPGGGRFNGGGGRGARGGFGGGRNNGGGVGGPMAGPTGEMEYIAEFTLPRAG